LSESTTYTCDRCNASRTDEPSFLETVGLFVGADSSYVTGRKGPPSFRLSAEWCEDCRVATGLARPPDASYGFLPTPLQTIDEFVRDIVRDIVREEIGEATR
jgi:hypothetical protein